MLAKAALLLTAILWGSTFTIGKFALESFSPSFVIALRFLIAAAALAVAAFPQRKQLDKQYWLHGFWMGCSLFASYILHIWGFPWILLPGKAPF